MVAMGRADDIRPRAAHDLHRLYGNLEYCLRSKASLSAGRYSRHGWRSEPAHHQVLRKLVELRCINQQPFRNPERPVCLLSY